MIAQAEAESLKGTTVPKTPKLPPNTNQPRVPSPPNSLLSDDKENHSSSPSQELAGPDTSQESYGGDWLNKLPPETLVWRQHDL
jgi:hypothetical protein